MKLLLQRDELVAVDKPAGLPVIPGREGGPCVRDLVAGQLARKVWVVHRLDRDTSGALIFALTPEAHRAWSMAFELGEVKKRYLALVEGRLDRPLEIDARLAPARRSRMKVDPGGKPSHTRVRPVETFAAATLVEAEPLTGRTHQIRVHLAHVGHPLLFDHQYRRAPAAAGLSRTPLHAAAIAWGDVEVVSPLPEDLAGVLERLRGER